MTFASTVPNPITLTAGVPESGGNPHVLVGAPNTDSIGIDGRTISGSDEPIVPRLQPGLGVDPHLNQLGAFTG